MAVWDTLLPYAPLITPVAVLAGAAAAYLGVHRTIRQKAAADRRAQTWVRLEWAAEQTLRPDRARQGVGIAALTALLDSADPHRADPRRTDPGGDHLSGADAEVLDVALTVAVRVRDRAQQALVVARAQAPEQPATREATQELYDAALRLEQRLRRAREPPADAPRQDG